MWIYDKIFVYLSLTLHFKPDDSMLSFLLDMIPCYKILLPSFLLFVQVVTSLGSSTFSNILTARTQYNFTELDKLEESMEKKTNSSFKVLQNNMLSTIQSLDTAMTTVLNNLTSELTRMHDFISSAIGKTS